MDRVLELKHVFSIKWTSIQVDAMYITCMVFISKTIIDSNVKYKAPVDTYHKNMVLKLQIPALIYREVTL